MAVMGDNCDNMDSDNQDMMELDHGDFLEDEEDCSARSSNNPDSGFDAIIGHIEEIVMEDKFQRLQNTFLEKYYHEFEQTEENKFCYTDIHREYVHLVERFLEEEIGKRVPEFSMEEFTRTLIERKQELEGEIFELLLTFSDFLAFKEMVLDFRAVKEGRTVDLSSGIRVTPVHCDGLSSAEGTGLRLSGHRFEQHP